MEQNKLCDYGCGKIALFRFKNGKYCCSKSKNSCEIIKNNPNRLQKIRKKLSGKKSKLYSEIVNNINILCDYGCGNQAKYKFKNGKYCCSSDHRNCVFLSKRKGNSIKKSWLNKDENQLIQFKNKLSKITKKQWEDPNCVFKTEAAIKKKKDSRLKFKNSDKYNSYIINLRNIHKNRWKNKNVKQEQSERMKKQWKDGTFGNKKYLYNLKIGTKKSWDKNETRKKLISELIKNEWSKESTKLRSKNAMKKRSIKMKNLWNDKNSIFHSKDYWRKRAIGENQKPNNPETLLIDLFKELNLDYKYVGDYKVWIDGKNPDFINYENKKVIEFFGSYYHDTIVEMSREIHEQERIEHFEKEGYKCLIIWEEDLKNINNLIQRILKFEVI